MEERYAIDPLVHDGPVYDALNTSLDDLPFYRKWCETAGGGPILELCCGTGRLTLPLAEAGLDVTGVDVSGAMLGRARAKAAARGLDPVLAQGDMRTLSLGRRFALVFIPFNSLQCIYSIGDLERIFEAVKAHLAPDGLFLFDVFNPSIRLMLEREGEPVERYRGTLEDGREVVVRERCRYDAAGQVNRVTWFHRIGSEETASRLDMRCFWPLEMDALLRYSGFRVLHKHGDFDESPFEADSPKQIYVCREAWRRPA